MVVKLIIMHKNGYIARSKSIMNIDVCGIIFSWWDKRPSY